jgi:hypothetical protein
MFCFMHTLLIHAIYLLRRAARNIQGFIWLPCFSFGYENKEWFFLPPKSTTFRMTHVYSEEGNKTLYIIWTTALQTERSRDRFPMVSLEFFIGIIPSVALWHWGRLNL